MGVIKRDSNSVDSEIVYDSDESSDEPIVLPPKEDDKYKNLYHELEGRLIALQDEKDDLVDQYNECQREVLRLKDEIEDLLVKNRMLSDKVADINSNMISNHVHSNVQTLKSLHIFIICFGKEIIQK